MKKISVISNWTHAIIWVNILLFTVFVSVQADESEKLTLKRAIEQAQHNDPWLVENQHIENALIARSISAGALPDPVVSISMLNLPVDGYDFNQENMTQLKMGISQRFPRGDTLQLKSKKLQILSRQNPYLREDRKLRLSVMVTNLWLDVFKAKESIRLIEKDRTLFEQLVDISSASYSTAFGGTQQQDVVRAQLELTRLDDRLTKLKQQQEAARRKLQQWTSGQFLEHYSNAELNNPSLLDIDDQLPELKLFNSELLQVGEETLTDQLTAILLQHPSIKALENKIKAYQTDIEISKQKYKPQWGVNAAYSYRADTPAGKSRADFLSLGINFDLPVFTENKQDKDLQASVSQAEAVKTEKWLLLREMMAKFKASRAELLRLKERSQLYQKQLLPQIQEQAEAALTAYTNDEGDFAEVVRARIDVLDAEIDNLEIEVDSQKIISQLNYYLATNTQNQESMNKGNK